MPDRDAGWGEVRMGVHADAVKPTDICVHNGARAEQQQKDRRPTFRERTRPGVLDEIGDGVDTGSPSASRHRHRDPQGAHGANSEHLVVPAESVARALAGVSDVEARTLPWSPPEQRCT